MRLIVFLLHNCFVVFAFLLCWAEAGGDCDTKWIRFMFLATCGKKKRELAHIPDDVFENAPTDFEGALSYFRFFNPNLFNETLLQQQFDEDSSEESSPAVPLPLPIKLLLGRRRKNEDVVVEWSSDLGKKLKNYENEGIRGFSHEWDLRDLMQKKTGVYQRNVSDLIEDCCNKSKRTKCTPKFFREVCKAVVSPWCTLRVLHLSVWGIR